MTIDEFDKFEWKSYYKAKYKGKWYDIECVNFGERLIGLDFATGIERVRCENVSVEYREPEESVWPQQKGGEK